MTDPLTLRPAEMADAERLLAWRNDIETCKASHNTDEVVLDSHLVWLENTLSKPDQRRLWIAEMNGKPVGTCRADRMENAWELSWTVAPEARGKGVAHQMLSVLMNYFDEPLLAQVRADNMASIKVVERAGFAFDKEESGVLYYVFFKQFNSPA